MDAKTYHAMRSLSHSQIEDFIESPSVFFGRHIAKTLGPRDDTDATDLGSAQHALALEGQAAYDERVAIWHGGMTEDKVPKFTTSKNSNAYKAFAAANAGRILLDPSDHALVEAMTAALHEHSEARKLLWGIDGQTEHTLAWNEGDIEARCRLDKVLSVGDVIVDLKTFGRRMSEKAIIKQALDLGYHRKAEWYRRGYFHNTGRPCREFLFVSVSVLPPHDVCVWRFDDLAEQLAHAQIEEALAGIRKCRETNDWRNTASVGIRTLTTPNYAVDRDLIERMNQEAA